MFHRDPILMLFRTLARRMGLLSLRRAARPAGAPEPADPPLVRLGPGGDYTRYWPQQPPPRGSVNGTRVVHTPPGFLQGVLDPWPHK
jgi:hypothetical protein